MFSELFELQAALTERAQAAKGRCPEARTCNSREDLAGWFKSVGVAAGAISRSRNVSDAESS